VIDQTEKSYIESSAAFTSECGSDNICKEDLEVEANFISDLQSVTTYIYLYNYREDLQDIKPIFSRELVVGAQNTISFEVRLVNYGEPSYLTTLEIQLPSYTNLKRTPADLCQKPSFASSEELMYSCQLRVNPLKQAKTVLYLSF
jgi:hypothetical protein